MGRSRAGQAPPLQIFDLRHRFALFHLFDLLLQVRYKIRLNVTLHFVRRFERGLVGIPG